MNVNLNIQEVEGDIYYFYHNWQAGQDNKIHIATCGFCRYGTGRNLQTPPTRGENGVWIGPFSTLALCQDYIIKTLKINNPPQCSVCL
jgi:hypothetical protein